MVSVHRTTVDRRLNIAVQLTGVGHKVTVWHRSSLRVYGEKEEGGEVLTGGKRKRRGGCGSSATKSRGGDALE
jgi:hypothetical protein